MLKKILCGLLASLMLVGTLVSCGETQEGSDETKGSSQAATTAESEVDTREPLEIPDTRYDDTELCFLTRDESEWSTLEIFAEEISSGTDNINNAVYERNLRILEKYGVTITELKVNTTDHPTRVTNEIAGSVGDFQAVITNTSQSASLASQGKLWDLHSDSIEHLDLSKSWWDQNMVAGLSIQERLYFATGDLLTSDNDATFVLLFNKQIATDNKLDDLYALVENDEWTMEKFYEYISRSAKDMDGKDGLSYDTDIAGFAYTGDSPYCFLFSGGITLCKKDADDTPYYELNVDRAQNISEMGKRLFDKTHSVDMNAVTTNGGPVIMEVGKTCFGEGHALFIGEVMQAVTRMRGYDVDFGIVPYPMYDQNQDGYFSMMHLTASMVSIPKSVVGTELTMTTSMIEAMAYHSVDTLTEQYYEINLKTRDAKDEKSGPMIDKILASRACDLAYYYQWGGSFAAMAGTLLPASNGQVSSLHKANSKKLKKEIEKFLKDIDKFSDN